MFAVNACDSRQPQFAILAHVPSKDTLTYTHTHTHTPTHTNRHTYTPTHTHTPPASAAVVVIMRLGRHTKCEREKNCGAAHKVAEEMHYRINGKFFEEIKICGIELPLNTDIYIIRVYYLYYMYWIYCRTVPRQYLMKLPTVYGRSSNDAEENV